VTDNLCLANDLVPDSQVWPCASQHWSGNFLSSCVEPTCMECFHTIGSVCQNVDHNNEWWCYLRNIFYVSTTEALCFRSVCEFICAYVRVCLQRHSPTGLLLTSSCVLKWFTISVKIGPYWRSWNSVNKASQCFYDRMHFWLIVLVYKCAKSGCLQCVVNISLLEVCVSMIIKYCVFHTVQ